MAKKSIYTPAKGVRLSRKKLYKLKQLGGGILETLFGGAEEGGDSPLTPLGSQEVEEEGGDSPLTPLGNQEVEEEGGDSPLTPLDGEGEDDSTEDKNDSPIEDEGGKGGVSPLEGESPLEDEGKGVLGAMMGTLGAVGTSAKETLDEMTTGNEPSVNLDSEESSILLNKDDEIRRLREENNKLLEENRELSLRLIQQLDTKIDTLEKVATPEEPSVVEEKEEEPSVVEEEEEPSVVEEEEASLEIPDDGEVQEAPEEQEQQEDPSVVEEGEEQDVAEEEKPLTPREKALGGRKHKNKNHTRRKRRH